MKRYLIIIVTAFIAIACGQKQETSGANAMYEGHDSMSHEHQASPKTAALMATHDSIMHIAGEIMTLKMQVATKAKTLDSLNTIKPGASLSQQKSVAMELIQQLEQADKSMMGWMHQYKADTLDHLSESQQDAYIDDQTSKMEAIRSQIVSAISESKRFVRD